MYALAEEGDPTPSKMLGMGLPPHNPSAEILRGGSPMCCRRVRPGPQESRQTLQFEPVPGRAAVPSLRNVWCPAQNLVYERAKRAAATFDERVVFEAFDTSDRETFLEWGISDALLIDGREVRVGPSRPPSSSKA